MLSVGGDLIAHPAPRQGCRPPARLAQGPSNPAPSASWAEAPQLRAAAAAAPHRPVTAAGPRGEVVPRSPSRAASQGRRLQERGPDRECPPRHGPAGERDGRGPGGTGPGFRLGRLWRRREEMRCSGAPGVTALAVRTGLLLGAARDGEALSSGTKRAVCKGVFRVCASLECYAVSGVSVGKLPSSVRASAAPEEITFVTFQRSAFAARVSARRARTGLAVILYWVFRSSFRFKIPQPFILPSLPCLPQLALCVRGPDAGRVGRSSALWAAGRRGGTEGSLFCWPRSFRGPGLPSPERNGSFCFIGGRLLYSALNSC